MHCVYYWKRSLKNNMCEITYPITSSMCPPEKFKSKGEMWRKIKEKHQRYVMRIVIRHTLTMWTEKILTLKDRRRRYVHNHLTPLRRNHFRPLILGIKPLILRADTLDIWFCETMTNGCQACLRNISHYHNSCQTSDYFSVYLNS
jgi:hypothetical protein